MTAMSHTETKRSRHLFLGTFIHCKSLEELEILYNAAIFVNEKGVIVKIAKGCSREEAEKNILPKLGWENHDSITVEVHEVAEGQFYFPGFIDTHIHASQYPNAGLFGKSTLLDWLNTYTFPMESSLSSASKASLVYTRCIQRTLSHGTTTAAYYATISVPSTNLLADLCLRYGQRAFIGRCCMDSLSPDYYRDESAEVSLKCTKDCIKHMDSIDPLRELVSPIITPRFAPSCSRDLMASLGKLHKETGLPVQTHISENKNEIALVKELFPEERDYASVYDRYGLLTEKTILAHAVHLEDHEVKLIGERGAKISHCPVSNSSLTSGMARVRWLMDKGLVVGLGTDVSGGYSASVLEAARQASLVSRCVASNEGGEDRDKLSVEEVLYMGTRGGAKVVGLEGKVGGFEEGMEWDAQLIGVGSVLDEEVGVGQTGPVDIFGWENWEEKIAKWLFNGDDRNTLKVWVKGRLVHERKA